MSQGLLDYWTVHFAIFVVSVIFCEEFGKSWEKRNLMRNDQVSPLVSWCYMWFSCSGAVAKFQRRIENSQILSIVLKNFLETTY